jgi:hypothetical protein
VDRLQRHHLRLSPAGRGDCAGCGHASGHRRYARDPARKRSGANFPSVRASTGADRGVDHQIDLSALDPVDHVRGAFADLVDRPGRDAHAVQCLRGSPRCDDREAEVA